MNFSEPVESLNDVSTDLRTWDMRKREGLEALMISAADKMDDQQRQIEDLTASVRLVKGYLVDWSSRLERSTLVRIGQMDSASRAEEKASEAQRAVLDVIRHMRELK